MQLIPWRGSSVLVMQPSIMLLFEFLEDLQPLEYYNYLSVVFAFIASLVSDSKHIYSAVSLGLLLYFYVKSTTLYILAHWRVWILFISVLLSLILGNSMILDIVVLIAAVLTLIILILFPISDKKKLTGEYAVGTYSFNIDIKLPPDTQLYNETQTYALPCQCWYPIRKTKHNWFGTSPSILWTSADKTQQLLEAKLLLDHLAFDIKVPKIITQHLMLISTNSTHSSPANIIDLGIDKKLPIAIYSHGLTSFRQMHTSCIEQLASHGFVVFSVDHIPSANCARPYKCLHKSQNFDYRIPGSSPDERVFFQGGVDRRSKEILLLIDHLATLSQELPIDMSQIHLFGHSFGAVTQATVASRVPTIKSAVLLDSWMFPMPDADRKRGALASILTISSDIWSVAPYQAAFRRDFLRNTSKELTRCQYYLTGTDHQNFCDTWMLANKWVLRRPAVLGPANRKLTTSALDTMTLEFFLYNMSRKDVPFTEYLENRITDSRLRNYIKNNLKIEDESRSNDKYLKMYK